MSFFLTYNLGLKEPAKSKTSMGSVIHKSYELLSLRKLALQKNEQSFDGEELGLLKCEDINPESATKLAFLHYRKLEQPQWVESDYNECLRILKLAIEQQGALFHPNNLPIIKTEQRFDFTLDRDWTHYYEVLPDGTEFSGTLSFKGTVDVVMCDKPGIIIYMDLKSGLRKDWGTGEQKDFDYLLEKDKQLALYYLALWQLYPDAKQIIMEIYFIKDGGMFTLPYEKSSLPKIEEMLRNDFEKIKKVKKPLLRNDWFCKKLCHYGKTNYEGTNTTICQHYHKEINTKGLNQVILENADLDKITRYSEGGGRRNIT